MATDSKKRVSGLRSVSLQTVFFETKIVSFVVNELITFFNYSGIKIKSF